MSSTTAARRRAGADPADAALSALRRKGVRDIDGSSLARALYAGDASLYRVPPQVVVRPHDASEVIATLDAARETGTPVTVRGAGTSVAGNAVGSGIVIDTRRWMNRVLDISPERRTARVQPGTVHAALQRTAARYGLRFGPDPSTHTRCTIGGMIGNNACGSRALGYGRTADNIAGLRVLLADGSIVEPGTGHSGLSALVDAHLAIVRTEFGRFGRQVSGYAMDQLLPEKRRSFDRFMAGTEGTLGLVLEAEVCLVDDAPARALIVLGYPGIEEAADAVPHLTRYRLTACEGLGRRLLDAARRAAGTVPEFPSGDGWLLAEVTGASVAEAASRAAAIAADAGRPHRIVTDPGEQAALWRIREDGAGLAARSLGRPAKPGWEDAAVPPSLLGSYLREFSVLLKEHGLDCVPYGHFGDGCVHARIDFELDDEPGRRSFRRFIEASADLVARFGGSMSGEHGDGRARSELLPRMYSPAALELMRQAKHVLDPGNLLNPGVLVSPAAFDADLRTGQARPRTLLRMTADAGSYAAAVHRCTGVGKCLADSTAGGGVMCPSYTATQEERDSTRGRARVLQEMLDGTVVADWSDPAVTQALDLCLSCKGCARDCPTGVDMAAYKAEALYQRYRGRIRPRSHYILGRLPRWARLAPPRLANKALALPLVGRAAKFAAGMDQRRHIPAFSGRSLVGRNRSAPVAAPDVWLWADSFTNHFAADTGRAAIALLELFGLKVGLIPTQACCGLTWISTGQLSQARKIIGHAVQVLHPYVAAGLPVIALEPSCLATLRSEVGQLLDDPRGLEVSRGVRSLAEFLTMMPSGALPDLTGVRVVAQPHCHHTAVMGWDADHALLERAGAIVERVGGCCGLAGNFGIEQGHYEVSVKIAEHDLLPAVRSAPPEAVIVADGISCRTQLADLTGIRAMHLAELLLHAAVR